MPQLHPNCFQPSEPSSVPSPKPPIRASELPVRSFAWSAVPVAGLLFRATPRHMHCASGRRRLLRTPLGAHHSTMAQWRASWGFRAQGCVCAGAACVRHASAPHSLHIAKCGDSAHRVLLRSDIYGGQRSNILWGKANMHNFRYISRPKMHILSTRLLGVPFGPQGAMPDPAPHRGVPGTK